MLPERLRLPRAVPSRGLPLAWQKCPGRRAARSGFAYGSQARQSLRDRFANAPLAGAAPPHPPRDRSRGSLAAFAAAAPLLALAARRGSCASPRPAGAYSYNGSAQATMLHSPACGYRGLFTAPGLLSACSCSPLRGSPPCRSLPGSAQTPAVVARLPRRRRGALPPGCALRPARPFRHCAAAAAWAGAPASRARLAVCRGLLRQPPLSEVLAPPRALPPGGFGSAPPSFAGYLFVQPSAAPAVAPVLSPFAAAPFPLLGSRLPPFRRFARSARLWRSPVAGGGRVGPPSFA